MRLYHFALSTNARRAVMTAVHLEAKVDLVAVDLARREHLKPDYLALNPNGKVPVLNDDGFVLWESHAIMQYLADKTPGQTVYPQEARARADVNRWLFWSAHHFQPAASVLNWEHNVKAMIGLGAPDPAAVKRGEELIVPLAAVLDQHLVGRTWVAQDKVTLADFALATPLMTMDRARLPVKDRPKLMRWFARVQELDAWKKTNP
jgi:glutathione S-transferase